jgi:hypothetical protein
VATDKARRIRPVGFQDVTSGTQINEALCLVRVEKFKNGRGRQTKLSENLLGVSAIVLEAGTIGAAADDIESITP